VPSPGKLDIRGVMNGDAFPNAEMFLRDPAGNAILLDAFKTARGRMGPMFLWLNGDKPMGQFVLTVDLDDKGNFSGVEKDGNSYDLSTWNQSVMDGNQQ
jgi:hypothetical protein